MAYRVPLPPFLFDGSFSASGPAHSLWVFFFHQTKTPMSRHYEFTYEWNAGLLEWGKDDNFT